MSNSIRTCTALMAGTIYGGLSGSFNTVVAWPHHLALPFLLNSKLHASFMCNSTMTCFFTEFELSIPFWYRVRNKNLT